MHLEDSILKDGERSDNIYVVVDSSKVARCKWCGITESEKWIPGQNGLFCSRGCSYASTGLQGLFMFIFSIAFSLFFVGLGTMIGSAGPAVFPSLVFLSFALLSLFVYVQGVTHRSSMPKNSRADDVPLDTALLRTVSASVNCPRCDANLDLRKIGEDRVFMCGYCGATGTVRIIDRSEQKRSGSGGSI